jgi:O-antigen ligase
MRLVLPFVAALLPLILLPSQFFYFDVTPKVLVLLAGTAVALVAWPGSVIRGRSSWLPMLFVAQLVWLAVASAASSNVTLSLNGGTWRRLGLIQYGAVLLFAGLVAVDCVADRARIRQYLRALTASGALISVYTIAQYFGYDPWLPAAGYHAGEAPFRIVRPPGTLGHADYLGSYLIFVFFAAWAVVAGDPSAFWRALGRAVAPLAGIAILFSGTRAAMLGCLAGLVFLLTRSGARRRWLQVGGLAAVSLLAFFFSPAGERLRTRWTWSLDEPLGGARPLLWRDSLRMAAQRSLTGFGPESFVREFPRHQSIELARAYPNFDHESPHNVLLDALAGEGIPGALLLLATWAVALYLSWRIESPWLTAALIGMLVSMQFMSFTVATAFSFYLLLALVAAMQEGALMKLHDWWRIPACGCAVALVGWGVTLAMTDRQLHATRAAIGQGNVTEALRLYEEVRRWHPRGSSEDLYFSRELAEFFRRTSDIRLKFTVFTPAFQAAGRSAGEAEARHTALYNLAIFFATQNDAANVERSLRGAIEWSPNWYKPHWALARLLQTQDKLPEALREAELAADCNGGKDAEVTQTLELIRRAQIPVTR